MRSLRLATCLILTATLLTACLADATETIEADASADASRPGREVGVGDTGSDDTEGADITDASEPSDAGPSDGSVAPDPDATLTDAGDEGDADVTDDVESDGAAPDADDSGIGDSTTADSGDSTSVPDTSDAASGSDSTTGDAEGDTSDVTVDPGLDSDGDGILDIDEIAAGTNPENPDSDLDHVDDAHDPQPLNAAVWQTPRVTTGQLTLIVGDIPASTSRSVTVHVAGEFNGWTHQPMLRNDEGNWEIRVPLGTAGDVWSYKFTQGNWDAEEGGYSGVGNDRTLVVPASAEVIAHQIRYWETESNPASTIWGNVDIIPDFNIPQLGRTGTIRVYTPSNYETSTGRYPVVYMQDGQNVFDRASAGFGVEWQVDETISRLSLEGRMPPVIVVAVDNGAERACDYSPFPNATGCEGRPGRLNSYLEFVVEVLKPWVDAEYRTLPAREHTAIIGSSRGGLVSVYAGIVHQEVFSKVGGVSPTLNPDVLQGSVNAVLTEEGRRASTRWWMDYGDAEVVLGYNATTMIAAMDTTISTLRSVGFTDAEIQRVIVPGAVHNEAAWAQRFDELILWLFRAG
jgi:predicted alpha/beta superfamily hydrolase